MSDDITNPTTDSDAPNWRNDPLENTPIVRRELPSKTTEDADEYEGPISLLWKGVEPDGAAEKVISDIRMSLGGLEKPSELYFHHVPLTEAGLNGPLVFVWGEDGSDVFHCEYVEKPEWEPLKDVTNAER